MNCPNCNNPIEAGQGFCGNCGSALSHAETETEPKEVKTEAPAAPSQDFDPHRTVYVGDEDFTEKETPAETPAETPSETPAETPSEAPAETPAETPAAEDNFNINFSTEDEDESSPKEETEEDGKKKKKKFKLGKFLLITIPSILVILAIIFNFSWIVGFAIKTFGSPEAYLKYCEKKGIVDTVETIGPIYENTVKNLSMKQTSSVDMSIEVSDTLLSILQSSDESMDLSFLKDIKLTGTTTQDGFISQTKLDLLLNGTKITDVDYVLDINSGDSYSGFPVLSDKYIFGESEGFKMPVSEEEFTDIIDIISQVAPSKLDLGKLLSEYTDIVFDCVENAKKESETLEIDGVKQKVTKITYEVSEEADRNTNIALLKALRDDEVIKEYIENFQKEYEKRGHSTDGDLCNGYVDAISSSISFYEKMEIDKDSNDVIYITDYVNSKHEIIGREISSDGEKVSYIKISDKDEFKVKMEFYDGVNTMTLTGGGTETDDCIKGDYELTAGEYTTHISVDNFDLKALEKGFICGTFTITPDKAMFGESAGMLSRMNLSFSVSISQSEGETTLSIKALAMGQPALTVTLSTKEIEFTEAVVPEKSQCVDENKFLMSLDFMALYTNLQKAGVPSELLFSLLLGSGSGLGF